MVRITTHNYEHGPHDNHDSDGGYEQRIYFRSPHAARGAIYHIKQSKVGDGIALWSPSYRFKGRQTAKLIDSLTSLIFAIDSWQTLSRIAGDQFDGQTYLYQRGKFDEEELILLLLKVPEGTFQD